MCKYILTQDKSQAIHFLLLQVLKAAESVEHCCHVVMCYLPTVSSRYMPRWSRSLESICNSFDSALEGSFGLNWSPHWP